MPATAQQIRECLGVVTHQGISSTNTTNESAIIQYSASIHRQHTYPRVSGITGFEAGLGVVVSDIPGEYRVRVDIKFLH